MIHLKDFYLGERDKYGELHFFTLKGWRITYLFLEDSIRCYYAKKSELDKKGLKQLLIEEFLY